MLTTLPQTSEGIYAGQLNATEPWLNFHVVDEYHNIWYGTDPADKTVVSSADRHWNFWIDSERTEVYDMEINLNTMKWMHSYNEAATAGINTIETDDEPVIWYDLQGRYLHTPTKGLLLMKRGKGVSMIYNHQ